MKKRIFIILCTFLILVIVGMVWYEIPVRLTHLNFGDVSEIVIFDGNTGKELSIIERDKIEHIIENFNSVKMKRDGISLFRMGYRFRMKIYLADGKKAGGRNNFIINSGGVIRDDPFFYEVIEGSTDFEYIQELFDLR